LDQAVYISELRWKQLQLSKHHNSKEGLSFRLYRDTLERIVKERKDDFLHISHSAWLAAEEREADTTKATSNAAESAISRDADYWLVGAYWNDQEIPDQTDRFLAEGIWENGYKDKYLERVRSMGVGDRIAIKAMFAQKHDLPFENYGKTIWGITIKATGTVVKNPRDGRTVEVEWHPTREPLDWYLYTHQSSILRLSKDDELAQRLIRFIFLDEPQDYQFFVQRFLDQASALNGAATPYSVADMLADGVFLPEQEIGRRRKT
jgi:hypothetical protein